VIALASRILAAVRVAVDLAAAYSIACPDRTVRLDATTCIDRLPWPNDDDEIPLLGVSGVREHYLEDDGLDWDAVTLCAEAGKRLCTADEWRRACLGTPPWPECPAVATWLPVDWPRVMRRDGDELARLDQHSDPSEYPDCRSSVGAMLMGDLEEWVMTPRGPRLTLGFWSRPARCGAVNWTHRENWHDYASAVRCCHDLRLP